MLKSVHTRRLFGGGALLALVTVLGGLGPARAGGTTPAPSAASTVYHYRQLVFANTLKELAELKPTSDAGPVVVKGVPILETKEFASYLGHYYGSAITTQSVNQLAKDVAAYVKQHDRLVVNVLIPNQDISQGQFRMAVVIGHYSELKFKGNRWFSDKLLEAKLGVKPGDEVRLSVLESAVNWANTNPFRHVEVLVNTINKEPGIADLDVAVQEHFPVRVTLSYADSGNDLIGNNQYSAGVQFGNLWGRDQQLSLQYTTTDTPNLYRAGNFDYRIPLPWHHFLVFDGAYALVQPTFYQVFNEVGKNAIADVHYIAPFVLGAWKFESSTGLDFKRINNDLLYSGQQVLTSAIDVCQMSESLSGVRPDRHGVWVIAGTVNLSPGGVDARNTDAAYLTAHNDTPGWPARYAYGTLVLQRRFDLPYGFQAFTKAIGQVSSADLPGSEELTIGGQATVRGYNELLYTGDQGVVLSEELQGPSFAQHLGFLGKKSTPLLFRPLVFFDYARVYDKHDTLGAVNLPPLASAGVGLRANLATNFTASFDFGWQILETEPNPQPNHCRGHVKVTFAY